MSLGTIIVGIVLIGVVVAIVKQLKKEKGCGCGGDCSSCTHCDHS